MTSTELTEEIQSELATRDALILDLRAKIDALQSKLDAIGVAGGFIVPPPSPPVVDVPPPVSSTWRITPPDGFAVFGMDGGPEMSGPIPTKESVEKPAPVIFQQFTQNTGDETGTYVPIGAPVSVEWTAANGAA